MPGIRKFPSTQHWPWSPSPHKPHRYHANPEFFIGIEVIISEKLDGGNTALSKGLVYSRSTGQVATEPWFDFIKGQHAVRTYGYPKDIYGESMYAVHTIEYDPLPDYYHVFHILDGDTFLAWDDVTSEASSLGFMTVPLLFRGVFNSVKEITDWFFLNLQQPSVYGKEREGFVLRDAGAFKYADFARHTSKYVRPNHVKTDVHWTKTWRPAELVDSPKE